MNEDTWQALVLALAIIAITIMSFNVRACFEKNNDNDRAQFEACVKAAGDPRLCQHVH